MSLPIPIAIVLETVNNTNTITYEVKDSGLGRDHDRVNERFGAAIISVLPIENDFKVTLKIIFVYKEPFDFDINCLGSRNYFRRLIKDF